MQLCETMNEFADVNVRAQTGKEYSLAKLVLQHAAIQREIGEAFIYIQLSSGKARVVGHRALEIHSNSLAA